MVWILYSYRASQTQVEIHSRGSIDIHPSLSNKSWQIYVDSTANRLIMDMWVTEMLTETRKPDVGETLFHSIKVVPSVWVEVGGPVVAGEGQDTICTSRQNLSLSASKQPRRVRDTIIILTTHLGKMSSSGEPTKTTTRWQRPSCSACA
jgi:hypothetical protein